MSSKPLDRHHRRCRSNGGSDMPDNISVVCSMKHRAWHRLFQNMTPEEIVQELNDVWLPSDVEVVVVQRRRKAA